MTIERTKSDIRDTIRNMESRYDVVGTAEFAAVV